MYDYIFRNALVVDGTGAAPYKANVATFAGSIAFIGPENITRGKNVINAEGMILAPGFIDIHSHMDIQILKDRGAESRVCQGITTDVGGNCGIGAFPYSSGLESIGLDVIGEYENWNWKDYSSFKSAVASGGIGNNQMFLVPHSALRLAAMGSDANRSASIEEIDRMCAMLSSELKNGAPGFSTGLYYAPCTYAEREEIEALLGVVKSYDRLFAVHHRCEGDEVVESLVEILELALSSGARTEISHLKAIGKNNQGKVDQMLSLIDEYRAKGAEVYFDQYPYVYGSTSMYSLLPPSILAYSKLEQRIALSMDNSREELKAEIMNPVGWDSVYEMVGPENIKVLHLSSFPHLKGMSLKEIGEKESKEPLDALFDILAEEMGLAIMTDVTTTEENVEKIMKHSAMCYGSDSLFSSPVPHPRSYRGTVEFLSKYVRDRKVIAIEDAIRKLSGAAAERLRINKERGYVKEGLSADLVLFSLDKLGYDEDSCQNYGIEYVLVGGKPVVANGVFLNNLNGKVLDLK